tara:strand:- start:1682 stop:2221 length:540 start_codon:yes stop_codon:yes gene_type:complete
MGWLRKKGRQLDKRIRKIFGKNGWLKVAALIGGGYMYSNWTPAAGTAKGPWNFVKHLGGKVKDFFWETGAGTKGTAGYVSSGPTWAGQVGLNIGSSVAVGVAQAKLMEGPMVGQQAGFAPQENTAINKAVAASNAAYGNVGNILDAYRNFDFGPGSTTMMVDSARNRNIRSSYLSPQIT